MELFGTLYLGAALLLLLASLPALDKLNFKPFGDSIPKRGPWRLALWDLVSSELGAVTVTYYSRGGVVTQNASLTPITAAAASQVQKQSAIVVFGVTGDVQALFTHNWGLDASAPIYGEPEVFEVTLISTALTTYSPMITFDRTNTNVLAINKPSTGDACTIRVTIRRPHSMGQ